VRIRRIKVQNYAGIAEAEVSFPSEGITIIEGPNETGKTSLIEAVDLILEFQDSSSHRKVKDIVPVGEDVGPEVEVDITAGIYEFTYSKRWKPGPETVLVISKPQREQLTGRDAHDRVREIIKEAVDVTLWNALRLVQGEGLTQAGFDVSSLGQALDLAAGGDVAGDREEALWDRIETEYAKYWTPGGKPKNTLREAEQAFEQAQVDADSAKAHLRDLDNAADEIERLELAAQDLQLAAEKAAHDAKSLADRVSAIEKIRHVVTAAQQELERATLVHKNAQNDRLRRAELVKAAESARQDLESVIAEIDRSAPLRKNSEERAEEARDALKKARAVWSSAQQALERARADSEYHRHKIGIELQTERLDRIKAAQPRLARASKVLESSVIDADLLAGIEAAYLELARAQAAEDRTSPSVAITALRDVQISIDGTTVDMSPDDEHTRAVHDTTRIIVPEMLAVSVTASADRTEVADHLEAARARYEDLCRQAGATDSANARALLDARTAAERDQAEARATIKRDLRDLTLEELADKVHQQVTLTTEYEQNRAAEPPMPIDDNTARDLETAAQLLMNDARAALERAEALAEQTAEETKEVDIAGASLTARLEIARATTDSAEKALVEALHESADEQLIETEVAAESDVAQAKLSAEEAAARLADADPDTLNALLTNATNVLRRAGADLERNKTLSQELRIRLRHDTERGPARDHDEAMSELERVRGELQRLTDRAAAVELLHDVFARHRQEARHRYAQPFRTQIENLGKIVYGPGFEITLDDNLSIETRTLDGTTLAFEQLSTGAQEQLGLLARLACATLVAPEGGAPVIFDDALGWTDPQRLARMGAAISTAADACQVIILTCVPDRYAAVGNARTVSM
jgi:AAA ATPase domain